MQGPQHQGTGLEARPKVNLSVLIQPSERGVVVPFFNSGLGSSTDYRTDTKLSEGAPLHRLLKSNKAAPLPPSA